VIIAFVFLLYNECYKQKLMLAKKGNRLLLLSVWATAVLTPFENLLYIATFTKSTENSVYEIQLFTLKLAVLK